MAWTCPGSIAPARRAALTGAFGHLGEGRVVVRTTAGDVAIPYADFARRAEIDAMVDEALRTGRSGTLIERAVAEVRLAMHGVSMTPRFSFDKTALAAGSGGRRRAGPWDRWTAR